MSPFLSFSSFYRPIVTAKLFSHPSYRWHSSSTSLPHPHTMRLLSDKQDTLPSKLLRQKRPPFPQVHARPSPNQSSMNCRLPVEPHIVDVEPCSASVEQAILASPGTHGLCEIPPLITSTKPSSRLSPRSLVTASSTCSPPSSSAS